MDKAMHDNQLRRQCMDIPNMCEAQLRGIRQGLEAVPDQLLKKIRKVIFTGCGDSYFAGIAAVPAFKKYAGAFASSFEAVRCMDAARYIEYEKGQEDSTLLVGISASGSPVRVMEALRRANQKGCHTLAVTNIPDSRAAKEAEYSLIVNTPPFPEPGPGLRNYFASISALFLLAVRMGVVKGYCSAESEDELCRAISSYVDSYKREFDRMDALMFDMAEKWKDDIGNEMIGDASMYATAAFVGAKFVEAAGKMTNAVDSENWCHVNYFRHNPERSGVMMIADNADHNHSRMVETMQQASKIGRSCILITDTDGEDYGAPASVTVCTVPGTPKGFEFLSPLLNYIPGTLLAAYVAFLNGEVYFRAEDSPQKRSGVGSTIGDSKVVIF
ncbi:MAG TPA: SIS domain-containing protein [Candidatus Lachnoclostridium pullistercoris]|uniref:Glutamine--fructose-6-phosphate aminotransferase [isomerizing] n=1 Tax=Candidatus Lachnoclostridium pullistercoris TaxID=2838632 RepID=A0A9D2PFC8_9FIRM|nr:SIS domain-containing protein [Candidatus Lachnoclostridium pullistercoris]